jgi:1,4-dihydroxy-2-naphthoate octaprenyltransferase
MTWLRSLGRHPWVRHLRLPFNLLLAPIFLWGVLLAGGSLVDRDVWLAFISLHVFLYGGTNAFNSYYDRDEGPIGGMLEPPRVDAGLLPFSLLFQLLGVPLAWLVGESFLVAWLALFVVFTAYSHPLVRLKANPALALGAVALGQGGIGFIAGWLTVRSDPGALWSADALLGALTTCVLLAGLYVVTQSYQVDEDRRRGDRTLPVILGPRRALRLAAAVSAIGGAGVIAVVAAEFGPIWAAALGLAFGVEGVWLWRFASRFDGRNVTANFRWVMRFAAWSSGILTAFILWHLGT